MDTHETKIFNAVLIAAGVIGVIITYFIVIVIRNQRRHLQLQQRYLQTELATLEKERTRIVFDLHDDLGPLLSVVKLQISSLNITQKDEIELVNKATQSLDNILGRIRGICNELMPQVLMRKGLIAAIKEFIAELNDQSSISITFTHNNFTVPKNSEIHIYRIIQELLNNAIKHSSATKIDIRILSSEKLIILTIADDGKGFDAEQIPGDGKGMGLRNILSRTEVLKGTVYIDTKPGKGATFSIEIPNKNGPQNTTRNSG